MLLLSGAVIVPILGVFASFSNAAFPQILAALAAIICFIGGPFRMLYAGLFEEGAPRSVQTYGPRRWRNRSSLDHPDKTLRYHHHRFVHPPAWRRPNTAELVGPPSVTENTTRLLDKEDRTDR